MPDRPLDVATQLFGELFRESAVLIAVFAPLDLVMQGVSLTLRSAADIIVVVATLFAVGVFLEVRYRCRY